MNRHIVIICSLIVMALLSAGCLTTQWDGGETTFVEKSDTRYTNLPPMAGGYPGGPGAFVPNAELDNTGDLAADQMIIRTSQIRLEVQNVTVTLDPIRAIAAAHGGYVGSLSSSTVYGNRLYATVTMRVPAREFEAAMAEIKALGSLKSESLSADDVTEEYVDLQARRTAFANQLAQYTRIMEKAGNVSEILEVQVQIERVQVELDRIDGRLRYLNSRVDYATITVTLEEPEPVGGREGFSLVSAINKGIAGFLAVTAGLVIILISIIPLIIIGVVVYGIYRWWKGKKKRPKSLSPEHKPEENPPEQ